MGRGGFESNVAHATQPDVEELVQSTDGRRAPGMFTIATARGNIVERDPPPRPEAQSAEYIGSMIKGGYGARYGDFGVSE